MLYHVIDDRIAGKYMQAQEGIELLPENHPSVVSALAIDRLRDRKSGLTQAVIAEHDRRISDGYVDEQGRRFAADGPARRLLQEAMAFGQYPQNWLTVDRLGARVLEDAEDAQELLSEILSFVAPIKQARYAKEVEIAQITDPDSEYDVDDGWP